MIAGVLIVAVVLVLMLVPLYLQGRFTSNIKQSMKCVAFRSPEVHLRVRSAFDRASLFYSDATWAAGAARTNDIEIWINKADVERAREIIELQLGYKVETSEFALIVHSLDPPV